MMSNLKRIGYFRVDKSMTKPFSFTRKNGSVGSTLAVRGAINISKKVFAAWLQGPRTVVYRLLIVRWRRNCRVSRAFFETSLQPRTTESSAKTVPPLIHSAWNHVVRRARFCTCKFRKDSNLDAGKQYAQIIISNCTSCTCLHLNSFISIISVNNCKCKLEKD